MTGSLRSRTDYFLLAYRRVCARKEYQNKHSYVEDDDDDDDHDNDYNDRNDNERFRATSSLAYNTCVFVCK